MKSKMAHSISSTRCFRSFALRALLRVVSLYAMSQSAPYRLRIRSRRAKPRGDLGLYVLRYVLELTSGRLLLMSTRQFLIRTEARSGVVVCAVRMGSAGLSILSVCVARELVSGGRDNWAIDLSPESESVRGDRWVAVFVVGRGFGRRSSEGFVLR